VPFDQLSKRMVYHWLEKVPIARVKNARKAAKLFHCWTFSLCWRLRGFQRSTLMAVLHIEIKTGGDDLREGSQAWAKAVIRGKEYSIEMNNRNRWADWSTHGADLPVPDGTTNADITSFTVSYYGGDPGIGTDNWNMDKITATLENGDVVVQREGNPVFRFKGEARDWVGKP
jgi:hypothetical protein